MHRTTIALGSGLLGLAVLAACADHSGPTAPRAAAPAFHVGYVGGAMGLGSVDNDASCHVGQKGARWAYLGTNQWDVDADNAQVVVSQSGQINMTCQGWMLPTYPDGSPLPRPERAVRERDVLCFLPPGVAGGPRRETRDADELFLPSGRIVLTCHLHPHRS